MTHNPEEGAASCDGCGYMVTTELRYRDELGKHAFGYMTGNRICVQEVTARELRSTVFKKRRWRALKPATHIYRFGRYAFYQLLANLVTGRETATPKDVADARPISIGTAAEKVFSRMMLARCPATCGSVVGVRPWTTCTPSSVFSSKNANGAKDWLSSR